MRFWMFTIMTIFLVGCSWIKPVIHIDRTEDWYKCHELEKHCMDLVAELSVTTDIVEMERLAGALDLCREEWCQGGCEQLGEIVKASEEDKE